MHSVAYDEDGKEHQAFLERMARHPKRINIGNDHYIAYYTYAGSKENETSSIGFTIVHKKPNGKWCVGSVMFDLPEAQRFRTMMPNGQLSAVWDLISREPLHVEPSIACSCGDHGYVRDGKWQPA